MYPDGPENHKEGYCADGTCPVKKKDDDDIPDWSQPQQGIYAKRTHPNPIEFLKTLQDMYERVVVWGERNADLPVEYKAFEKELQKRTSINDDSSVL
ncbi:hypothetical protein BC827DRAFT_1232171 [Russula dissimulans]|jgi:hypothetical protein|nr:hypothetical protein BC827DRAFT_1232171 [Russula dissimulans]